MRQIEQRINQALAPFQVEIKFGKKAVEDFSHYKKEQQEEILALLIARARKGPRIRPNGVGESLRGELHGFTKIKPKHLKLRIIYRPMENGMIRMEVIAIGPRDKKRVYQMAAERLVAFKEEMVKNA